MDDELLMATRPRGAPTLVERARGVWRYARSCDMYWRGSSRVRVRGAGGFAGAAVGSVPTSAGETAERDEPDQRDDDAKPQAPDDRDDDAYDDKNPAEADSGEAPAFA